MKRFLLSIFTFMVLSVPASMAVRAVGAIPSELNVTETGAAIYQIPIECPTGVGGLTPQLSFVYNSQAGDGLMGTGWTIGGLSAITRVPKNHYIDGKSDGVKNTTDDALSLDGVRLIRVSTADSLAEYRLENDIYMRIVGYEPQEHGCRYFKVYTKEGLTLTFGSADCDGDSYAWPLTEVCDANGNYMSFENITSYGGDMQPATGRIVYGKNKSGAGMESVIEFEYETSPAAYTQYVGGKAIDKWARIKRVRILGSGNRPIATYSLTYTEGGAPSYRSLLSSIGYSRGNMIVNSTKFTWSEDSYCIRSVSDPKPSSVSYWQDILSMAAGDITGDGKTNVAFVRKDSPLQIYDDALRNGEQSYGGDRYDNVMFYDIDHDGVDEVIASQSSITHRTDSRGNGIYNRTVYHKVGKWDASEKRFIWRTLDGYLGKNTDTKMEGYYSCEMIYQVAEIPGDYYGNGSLSWMPIWHELPEGSSSEAIAASIISSMMGSHHPFDDGSRPGSCSIAYSSTGNFPSVKKLAQTTKCVFGTADFNGNGKTELLKVTKGCVINLYEERDGYMRRVFQGNLGARNQNSVYTGDFNGDGNTDLLVLQGADDAVSAVVYLSTGTKFVRSNMGLDLKVSKSTCVTVLDVNGDGKSDLFITDDDSASLYLCNGVNFERVATASNDVVNPDAGKEDQIHRFNSLLAQVSDGKSGLHYLSDFDGVVEISQNDLFCKLVKIEDGLDNTISIEYAKNKQTGSQVTSVIRRNSSGEGTGSSYTYGGILFDSVRNRFMGYSSFKVTESESGNGIENRYTLRNSMVQLDRRDEYAGGIMVRTSTYTYDLKTLDGTRVRTNLMSRQTVREPLTGLEQSVEYKRYDRDGNPVEIRICNGGQTMTRNLAYGKFGKDGFTRLTSEDVIYSYGGNTENESRYLDYDDKGNLTLEKKDGLLKLYSDYDVFGNCGTMQYGDGSNMRTEKYSYTESGRHVASKTNCLGETATFRWDESTGLMQSETDAYGNRTTYRYDGLGSLKSKTTPDGVTVSVEKSLAGSNMYKAYYRIDENTSGKGTVTTWYTSDGREVCRQTCTLGGKKVYVMKRYNKDGTLERVSKPSFDPMPREWAESYVYDHCGRTIKVSRADGDTKIKYSGLTTTTQTPSETVSKTLTPEGWTGSVTTNGKTVRYTHYPTGRLKSATPDGGSPVYMEYDCRGNRTLISEADGGTVKKNYNVFGELTGKKRRQGSGSWATTAYTYSLDGLLMRVDCDGSITNYIYDSRNQLISKTMAGGISKSYEYDRLGRMVKTTDRIDGRTFESGITYDNYGRELRRTYPSGYYTENVYDENGMLVAVTDKAGNNIYSLLETTATGRITKERRGGMVTEYEYDNLDRLTSKVCGGIMSHTYGYDAKSNLTQFTDKMSGQSFRYTYDDLNRLTGWDAYMAGSAAAIYSDYVKYDDANNMAHRGSFGDCIMTYDDAEHPHAVSSISGVPNNFPKLDQNITYTPFGKVESVSQGERSYDITYSPNEERLKTESTTEQGKITRYYVGGYEEVIDASGNVSKFHYLTGGAMMVEKNGVLVPYYNYTDRLGSIVATADELGHLVERYAYNPWGERLNPDNWAERDTRENILCNRGFTGHEHIDGLDLINMNGRMYDPLTGMFMSVDPFIQAPGNWLNYNPYLYCFGNPLKYIDPSGNIGIAAVIGIGAAIGAVLGTGAGLWYGCNKGYSGWDLAKSALIGAGIGAGIGAVSGYFIGSSISSVMASKSLWNFTRAGASMGEAAGMVGGSIYGLAKKSDGLALANYIGLGSLIGMAAGAVAGAGCYGIYSLYTSASASYSAAANALTLAEANVKNASMSAFNGEFKYEAACEAFDVATEAKQNEMLVDLEVAKMNANDIADAALLKEKNLMVAYDLACRTANRAATMMSVLKVAGPICGGLFAGGAGYGGYSLFEYLSGLYIR